MRAARVSERTDEEELKRQREPGGKEASIFFTGRSQTFVRCHISELPPLPQKHFESGQSHTPLQKSKPTSLMFLSFGRKEERAAVPN